LLSILVAHFKLTGDIPMADPRNVAHDKKVEQEKKEHHEPTGHGAIQPGKKPTAHQKQEAEKREEEAVEPGVDSAANVDGDGHYTPKKD